MNVPHYFRNALLAVGLASLLLSCGGRREIIRVTIGGEVFQIEVARTEGEKTQGLMHRKALGPRQGMIFVYEADEHLSFWMKDTSLSLTLAFLSKDGQILQIEEMKPFSLRPLASERAARYALELPRGALESLGVRVGDRVILPEGLR